MKNLLMELSYIPNVEKKCLDPRKSQNSDKTLKLDFDDEFEKNIFNFNEFFLS